MGVGAACAFPRCAGLLRQKLLGGGASGAAGGASGGQHPFALLPGPEAPGGGKRGAKHKRRQQQRQAGGDGESDSGSDDDGGGGGHKAAGKAAGGAGGAAPAVKRKAVVFLSSCDGVELHHALLGGPAWRQAAGGPLLGVDMPLLKLHGDMPQAQRTAAFVTFSQVRTCSSSATPFAGIEWRRVAALRRRAVPAHAGPTVAGSGRGGVWRRVAALRRVAAPRLCVRCFRRPTARCCCARTWRREGSTSPTSRASSSTTCPAPPQSEQNRQATSSASRWLATRWSCRRLRLRSGVYLVCAGTCTAWAAPRASGTRARPSSCSCRTSAPTWTCWPRAACAWTRRRPTRRCGGCRSWRRAWTTPAPSSRRARAARGPPGGACRRPLTCRGASCRCGPPSCAALHLFGHLDGAGAQLPGTSNVSQRA